MNELNFYVVIGFAIVAVGLSLIYFRRYQINRPPIGVYNLIDIFIMIGFIIFASFIYTLLPAWLAAGLLILTTSSVLFFVLEAITDRRWIIWLGVLVLLGGDISVSIIWGKGSEQNIYYGINDLVLVVVIIGITNLWAQSGMKVRDATILGLFLGPYDYGITSLNTLTGDLFNRLSGQPLWPLVAWSSQGGIIGIGLGDLLLTSVFPLIMRKAFGRQAGTVAILCSIGTLALIMVLPLTGVFPVMVIYAPVMLFQYGYYRLRLGMERTTFQYMELEPIQLFV